MEQVSLSFHKFKGAEKIQTARSIIGKMNNNASYTTPSPTLDEVEQAVDAFEASYEAARGGGVDKKATQHDDEKALNTLMSQLADYVQSTSKGNEAIILSSGMGIKSKATAPQVLPAPVALKATPRTNSGEVDLKWKRVEDAKSYMIQSTATPDDATSWETLDTCTKASHTVTGLTSLSNMWFRIAAVGPKGKSQWSDPAKSVVA